MSIKLTKLPDTHKNLALALLAYTAQKIAEGRVGKSQRIADDDPQSPVYGAKFFGQKHPKSKKSAVVVCCVLPDGTAISTLGYPQKVKNLPKDHAALLFEDPDSTDPAKAMKFLEQWHAYETLKNAAPASGAVN